MVRQINIPYYAIKHDQKANITKKNYFDKKHFVVNYLKKMYILIIRFWQKNKKPQLQQLLYNLLLHIPNGKHYTLPL